MTATLQQHVHAHAKWKNWELEALIELLAEGQSYETIAGKLDRSISAVEAKAQQIRNGEIYLPRHIQRKLMPVDSAPKLASVTVDITDSKLATDLKTRLSNAVRNSRRTGGRYAVTAVATDGRRVILSIQLPFNR